MRLPALLLYLQHFPSADALDLLQVTDTKPKRPSWGLMSSSSEGVATAIAAWGHFVIMGDTEGSLNRWDTQTGRISTMQTTQVQQCKTGLSCMVRPWVPALSGKLVLLGILAERRLPPSVQCMLHSWLEG